MPGFFVRTIGDPSAPADNIETYYSFTWEIPIIFGKATDRTCLIYLRDASLPSFSVGQERVKGASLNYKYASDVTWEDIKVTWYDTKGMLAVVTAWRESVWTVDGGLQPPDSYKKETVIYSSLPDGTAINSWRLVGSWPSTIRHGDLTYTQSEVKVVDVTITYDWAIESSPDF